MEEITKMKPFLIVLLFVCLFLVPVFGQAPGKVELSDPLDYLELLVNNKVYPKYLCAVEHQGGFLYLLDRKICTVFKVNMKTGNLEKTIFSRGQGPAELMNPTSLKISNGRLYVQDRGFNGIKVAKLDGTFVTEFKVAGTFGDRNIEVNSKGEILVAK